MKNKRRKKRSRNCQTHFKKTKYSFHQYWIMYYTEILEDLEEHDYISFIKAKSYNLAKIILSEKIKEDNENSKVKAISGFMFHKNYMNSRSKERLSIADWQNIKDASFPNLNNFLFRKETKRTEGHSNRFNKTDYEHLKTIGFKSGEENWSVKNRKGKFLPLNQREGKKWNGDQWVDWDKDEMKATKNSIIEALIKSENNRSRAAAYLKIGRNTLYKLMCRCVKIDWWNENFPAPRPIPPRVSAEQRSKTQREVMLKRKAEGKVIFQKNEEQEALRLKNLKIKLTAKSQKYRKSLIPIIKNSLLKNKNKRAQAARSINVKPSTFRRWMYITKDIINWKKEYPVRSQNEN
jgi:hypothetical protein